MLKFSLGVVATLVAMFVGVPILLLIEEELSAREEARRALLQDELEHQALAEAEAFRLAYWAERDAARRNKR